MDELLKGLGEASSEEEKAIALTAFLASSSGLNSFAEQYGENAKVEAQEKVFELVKDESLSDGVRIQAAEVLKVILRDKVAIQKVVTFENVITMLQMASLFPPDYKSDPALSEALEKKLANQSAFKYPTVVDEYNDEDDERELKEKDAVEAATEAAQLPKLDDEVLAFGPPVPGKESAPLQAEVAKCLVNIITRDRRGETMIEALGVLPRLLWRLGDKNHPSQLRFPMLRMLLRMSFERVAKLRLHESKVLNTLADVLEICTGDLENTDHFVDLVECLKVIFSLSLPLGPLEGPKEPSEEQFQAFKSMTINFQKLLFLPNLPKYDQVKVQTVTALINVPARCTELFDPERTLASLIYVLNIQADAATVNEEIASEALTPVLLVLTSIAQAIPRARGILKHAVFPEDVLRLKNKSAVEAPKELENGNSLASKLLNYMTSFNPALKHYVNNFFYIILDEDAEELVRLTGFGRAAGLLATLKLFGMDKVAEAQLAAQRGGGAPPGPASDEGTSGPEPSS